MIIREPDRSIALGWLGDFSQDLERRVMCSRQKADYLRAFGGIRGGYHLDLVVVSSRIFGMFIP